MHISIAPTRPFAFHGRSLGSVARGLTNLFRTMAERRAARASLGALSAAELRDIGLIADDVCQLTSLSPSTDHSTELATRAGLRAGNW